MKIVHNDETNVAEAESAQRSGTEIKIGGARLLRESGSPDMWALITQEALPALIHLPDSELIMACDEEAIEAELAKRYPVENCAVARRFIRTSRSVSRRLPETPKPKNGYTPSTSVDGWYITNKPFIGVESIKHIADLIAWSGQLGPIWIYRTVFTRLFVRGARYNTYGQSADYASDHGFTCKDAGDVFDSELIQLNYNPGAISRREYNQQKAKANDRLRGKFPKEVLHSIYARVTPNNWPSWHPFSGVVRGRDLTEDRGWGHIRYNPFDEDDIVQAIALSRRLGGLRRRPDRPEPWWRTERYTSYTHHSDMDNLLKAALPYLHGVEQAARKAIADALSSARGDYDMYCGLNKSLLFVRARVEGSWADDGGPCVDSKGEDLPRVCLPSSKSYGRYDRDPRIDEPQAEFGSYCERFTDLDSKRKPARDNLVVCRWLRVEAKASKTEIPKPPVQPLSPAEVRRRAKARRKQRQSQRACKRKGQLREQDQNQAA